MMRETAEWMALMKMCEKVYEKKIDDVKDQVAGEESTSNIKLKYGMRQWLRRHCGPESDENQKSRPRRRSRIT